MNDRPCCRYCRKPMANAEDCDTFQPGEGEHLCWHILQNCDQDQDEAIDLRDAEIERIERELAAERALADRLAHWLSSLEGEDLVPPEWDASAANALAAWKEARNDT